MPKTRGAFALVCSLALWLVPWSSPVHAQLMRPRAELAPVMQQRSVEPGQTVTGALRIQLPDGIHVQSDAPREEYLIPTRLTFTLPEGVSVEDIEYPPASDWFLEGQEEPLAVFESAFSVDWRLAIGQDVAPGELVIPASFQYQSCDDRLCYPPVTAPVEWRVRVERPRDR